jgi:hypothetical protein
MKLFFAGATHAGQIRVREQIHKTLKTALKLIVSFYGTYFLPEALYSDFHMCL